MSGRGFSAAATDQPIGRSLTCAIAALAQLACSGIDDDAIDVDAVIARDGAGNVDKTLDYWASLYRRTRVMARAGMVRSPDAWRVYRQIHATVIALRIRRDGARFRSPLPEPLKVIRRRFEGRPLRPRGIHRRGFKAARGDPDLPHTAPPAPGVGSTGGRQAVDSLEKHPRPVKARDICTGEFNSASRIFQRDFFANGEPRLDGGRR